MVGREKRQRGEMSYTRMRLAFGNGDKAKGKQIMEAIAERLEHARRKHPPEEWEGQGPKWAAGKLADELSELHRAITVLRGQSARRKRRRTA